MAMASSQKARFGLWFGIAAVLYMIAYTAIMGDTAGAVGALNPAAFIIVPVLGIVLKSIWETISDSVKKNKSGSPDQKS